MIYFSCLEHLISSEKSNFQIFRKLDAKILTLEDAVCEHQIKRGLGPIRHKMHFIYHGFQTEERAGWWYNPKENIWIVYEYLKAGYPDYAVGFSLWLVKTFFALPFILEDKIDRKKRKD